jgi:hypothetical protein
VGGDHEGGEVIHSTGNAGYNAKTSYMTPTLVSTHIAEVTHRIPGRRDPFSADAR